MGSGLGESSGQGQSSVCVKLRAAAMARRWPGFWWGRGIFSLGVGQGRQGQEETGTLCAIHASPRATLPSSGADDCLRFSRTRALELELITLSRSPPPNKNSGSVFASGMSV